MQIHITARRMELTSALADYARKKLERIARHFEIVIRAQVILAVEKHRHIAEVVVHAQGHHDFRAREVAGDLYAAIDLALEKLQRHLAREKDRRVRGRRGGKITTGGVPVPANGREPVITRISRMTPRFLTAAQAARELDESEVDFLVYLGEDDAPRILYRRPERSYGLLEINL